MTEKASILKKAKEKAKARRQQRRDKRRERWADKFPFNMLHDMWRGFTDEPR